MSEIEEILNKCIGCPRKPCRDSCPLNNDTTGFIKLMKENKYKEAYELLCETTVLSSICGRICPHTKQCEGSCVGRFLNKTVEIGKLEAYIGDLAIENNWEIPKISDIGIGKKIAVVGGGPAGLTCAAFLKRNDFDVTIYEKHEKLGGVVQYGIPDFRLDRKIIDDTINKILELGINVEYNKELGKDIFVEELQKEYDAIFLSFGKNISSKMGIEGEEKSGVYGANELLEYKNFPDFKNKKVAVIGGGDVAMDASRVIKRLGAKEVTIIYRRSREEMPAEDIEIKSAIEEKIEVLYQTNILKIIGNENVEKIECIKTELIEKDDEKRKYPVNIEGSNFYLDVDYVIMAIGSETEKDIVKSLGLELTDKGSIKINDLYQTSNPKIFAGGDLINSKQTVAWAARTGKDAAENIMKYLLNK